jgi:hypothetical protein
MTRSNMEMLNQEDFDDALVSEFSMGLDVTLNHNAYDTQFIERWHERHAGDPALVGAAKVNEEVLIYHRGVGQANANGFFIQEKIDLIVETLLYNFLLLALTLLFFWEWPEKARAIIAAANDDDGQADNMDNGSVFEAPPTANLKRQSLRDVVTRDWTMNFQR